MIRIRPFARLLIAACSLALMPALAGAQEQENNKPFVWDIAARVVLDPTTYVPATMSYSSELIDWKSSQVFFRHGWMEQNAGFTVSGLPNDRPVSYGVGKARILGRALGTLQLSVLNNVAMRAGERVLIARYPQHRKLVRAVGWIERISFGAYLSYLVSADHFRQADRNHQLAREYGY